ncbi:MAG: asparagine synthase (glutamine-hydrolyzing), partial [Planctomycetes bacterium]|nr:asparagine synthase (glutamine-hydrolyzing) [Planctomycetota bacterium]
MCGICGVFDYVHRKPVAPRLIEDMCAAMRHRGPDDTGTFEREGLCLGHVRLSIIDLTHGAQPMSNEDGAITVVFNGEIYNHLELRDELAANGHVLKTRSDTEVLVHLYEDHGFEMCHKLIGEFAFAIWDDREQLLFAARDRLGVKPLIYAVSDGRFAFASDFNALMTDRRISRELDDDGLASYLTFQTILAPRTIYRAVHKLPPGHYAVVRKGDVRVVRYWDVEFAPDESRSVESFAEEIDDLVTDSVRRQMIADVDLGAFLSGGLDSSTIVTKMTRLAGRGVKTFSIGFGDAVHMDRSIRLIEGAGAAAIEIEDQVAPKRVHHHKGVEHLISSDEMAEKIRAAVDARRNEDFTIIARCNAISHEGVEAALERGAAYAEAGADLLMFMPRND